MGSLVCEEEASIYNIFIFSTELQITLTLAWYKSSVGIVRLLHMFGCMDCKQTTHSNPR